jgi:hypothetical protein
MFRSHPHLAIIRGIRCTHNTFGGRDRGLDDSGVEDEYSEDEDSHHIFSRVVDNLMPLLLGFSEGMLRSFRSVILQTASMQELILF